MKTILFWGIVIGIISEGRWELKIISAFLLGMYSCFNLFFLIRKKRYNILERFRLKMSGSTDEAIENLGVKVFNDNRIMMKEAGLTSPKIYIWEFTRTFIGVVIISLIVGFIKSMF